MVFTFSEEPLMMKSDSKMIEQVFVNLLTNAIHAVREKGSDEGRIEIGTKKTDSNVEISIEDNGAGISEEKRPMGSFIFLGPTGVGKTELARALAQFLFDNDEAIVRIDMSEYMEKHSVARLIGSPPGYVGYDEGGQLTEAVRRRPYSVVLFDEIEKAHTEVLNVLLQVLDDGRLTDAKGRVVNFKNTIIIMTSNIGSDLIIDLARGRKIGFDDKKNESPDQQIEERITGLLREKFKPEFLNRVDDTIIFHSLSQEQNEAIVHLQFDQMRERIQKQGIVIDIQPDAVKLIAKKGYDPNYGARPLKRILQREVLDPLAMQIVEGEVRDGDRVTVHATGTQITLGVRRAKKRKRA